jgi:hypothetical protein
MYIPSKSMEFPRISNVKHCDTFGSKTFPSKSMGFPRISNVKHCDTFGSKTFLFFDPIFVKQVRMIVQHEGGIQNDNTANDFTEKIHR